MNAKNDCFQALRARLSLLNANHFRKYLKFIIKDKINIPKS